MGDLVNRRRLSRLVPLIVAALALTACAQVVDGQPSVGNAPNAHLSVKGSDDSSFDQVVENSLSDIEAFWKQAFPTISGGKSLTPLKGGLYSVDGLKVVQTGQVTGPAASNACAQKSASFVVDNGAFCTLDDSISWDRSPDHLFAQLGKKYGDFTVAMIFAHEFGHSISYRLGVFDRTDLRTIDTESQADCAAGAWVASALKGQDPHFRNITPQTVDEALEGFLNGRDSTPDTPEDVSHGNGFDRLSAVADGIDKGVKYCFSSGYFASRTFTERPYTSQSDYDAGGNAPISDQLDTSSSNYFVKDLNRFWTAAAKSINKSFTPVKIASATHPPCEPKASFGYCPDQNTVYFDPAFAKKAYYSLPGITGDKSTGNVQLVENQPGDFALGVLFSIGWGMAVRNQLFNRSLDDQAALQAAVCYSGAYAKDVNVASNTPGKDITLSPSDLDEATSAMIDQVGKAQAFGARGTTGLSRIQDFVKGYKGGLSVC
ncbi:neutral zinc metallopeptidase [Jatrophihabitans endophyticus]|uniref:neutral zinc metallopeptidase n=1 Tax=Jatrophihabitans endophyticus TaxID=1206085 RepID=UPI0019E726D2|nr:neutral zinc metallopeptidase [Jatrophihabitans endophyticus]MBE7190643.1 neutral zinc metallopeptidase [Jatrophihabitans endophyticus]